MFNLFNIFSTSSKQSAPAIWGDDQSLRKIVAAAKNQTGILNVFAQCMVELYDQLDAYNASQSEKDKIHIELEQDVAAFFEKNAQNDGIFRYGPTDYFPMRLRRGKQTFDAYFSNDLVAFIKLKVFMDERKKTAKEFFFGHGEHAINAAKIAASLPVSRFRFKDLLPA